MKWYKIDSDKLKVHAINSKVITKNKQKTIIANKGDKMEFFKFHKKAEKEEIKN